MSEVGFKVIGTTLGPGWGEPGDAGGGDGAAEGEVGHGYLVCNLNQTIIRT